MKERGSKKENMAVERKGGFKDTCEGENHDHQN